MDSTIPSVTASLSRDDRRRRRHRHRRYRGSSSDTDSTSESTRRNHRRHRDACQCNNTVKKECCTQDNKRNKRRLDPDRLFVSYHDRRTSTRFSLPRRYTNTHSDRLALLYLAVGPNYNYNILSDEDTMRFQDQIVGEWRRDRQSRSGYRINMRAIVDDERNTQSELRNQIFCRELGLVLEAVGFAEDLLVRNNRRLRYTPIYIQFESSKQEFQREEYWGKLARWLPRN